MAALTGRVIIVLAEAIVDDLRSDAANGISYENLPEISDRFSLPGLEGLFAENPDLVSWPVARSLPAGELFQLEERAPASGRPPRTSLFSYWVLDFLRDFPSPREEADQILWVLRAGTPLPEVTRSYVERGIVPAGVPVDSSLDIGVEKQGYLDPGPRGVNAKFSWSKGFCGEGIQLVDVEMGWCFHHPDLKPNTLDQDVQPLFHGDSYHVSDNHCHNHGTQVLGILVAAEGEEGVDNNGDLLESTVGVVPRLAWLGASSTWEEGMSGDEIGEAQITNAILACLPKVSGGDVVLLEVQTDPDGDPVETYETTFTAISDLVGDGIIVVEASGNGEADLPTVTSGGDSGAIVVGAARSVALPHLEPYYHERWISSYPGRGSSYGPRVNCYAWGENVWSAKNHWEYGDFNGTSAASAVIAGVAAVVQQMYLTLGKDPPRLTPLEMREILENPDLGTPCDPGGKPIGVMPDLRLIASHLGIGQGVIPPGLREVALFPDARFFISPDIIFARWPELSPSTPPVPRWSAGELLGLQAVQADDQNHLFVRLRATTEGGDTASVRCYWSEATTLPTPGRWHFISEVGPVPVEDHPEGTVIGPIRWCASRRGMPRDGYGCVIADATGLDLGRGSLPSSWATEREWKEYLAQLRDGSSVLWRNCRVLEVDPTAAYPEPLTAEFLVQGAPDRGRRFEFRFQHDLPKGVRPFLSLPKPLARAFKQAVDYAPLSAPRSERLIGLPAGIKTLSSVDVHLDPNDCHECTLDLVVATTVEPGQYPISLLQILDDRVVGGVHWLLRSGRPDVQ